MNTHIGYLSLELLILIIKNEGTMFFNLVHNLATHPLSLSSFARSDGKDFCEPLSQGEQTEMESCPKRPENKTNDLTDMLPTTASGINPPSIDPADYDELSTKGWHIHPDGSLHIPEGATLQNLDDYAPENVTFYTTQSQACNFSFLEVCRAKTAIPFPI